MRRNPSVLLLLSLVSTGCSGAINPFVDDAPPYAEMMTHSERVLHEANATAVVRQRGWSETHFSADAGEVIHWPLWHEDPFEDKGDGDDTFAWTYADFIALPYCAARAGLNGLGLPVSMVVTPACTPMVSDGLLSRQALGYDHDAARVSDEDGEGQHPSADAETSN
jgi:hypothetical protein